MYPILFSAGPVHIYSFSVFIVLAWCIFSFLFWKALRQNAVDEDKIYDVTFYATIFAFICARFFFVIFHIDLFSDTWLKIFAIWVQPGLSLYGGLIGAIVVFMLMSRSQKVRVGLLLDAFAQSFPWAATIACIGTFLDGTTPGTITTLPWAMRSVGQVGLLHPVALYQLIVYVCMAFYIRWLSQKSVQQKYPYGMVGVVFFMVLSILLFAVEFTAVRTIYWISLSASQWMLIAIFAESMGAFYVRGGGRERLRPLRNKLLHIKTVIKNKYNVKT